MSSNVGILSVKHRMQEERDHCAQGILKARYLPNRMEDWHPTVYPGRVAMLAALRSNLANVAILGGRYGERMPGYGLSHTHCEILVSLAEGIPCYVLIADPDHMRAVENDFDFDSDARESLCDLKRRLDRFLGARRYSSLPEIRDLTWSALTALSSDVEKKVAADKIAYQLNEETAYLEQFSPIFECVIRTDVEMTAIADAQDLHILDGSSCSYSRILAYIGGHQTPRWALIDGGAPNAILHEPALMRVYAQVVRTNPKRLRLVVRNVIASLPLTAPETQLLKYRPDAISVGSMRPELSH